MVSRVHRFPLIPDIRLHEEASPPRLFTAGTCNVDNYLGGLRDQGFTVDHMLWETYSHSPLPEFDQSSYDAVLAAPTLTHILVEAYHLMRPDEPYGNVIAWPRMMADGMEVEYFDRCRKLVRECAHAIASLCDRAPLFVMSFLEPKHNYLGNLLPRYDLRNPKRFVERLNVELAKALDPFPNAYFFDMNELFALVGNARLQDDYVFYIGHASLFAPDRWDRDRFQPAQQPAELYDTDSAMAEVTEVIAQRLLDNLAIVQKPLAIKAIIVDLDDTLWRGILADEGDKPAHEFVEGWPSGLAEALLIYKTRGGMLAIASKNERSFIEERWPHIYHGRIRLEDFASVRINFDRKSENVRAILEDLNILPGNVLFVDDNPREIDEVRGEFPDMHFLSAHHYDWRRTILMSPATQVAGIAADAQLRTASVQANIERAKASTGLSRDEWLASLCLEQTVVTIRDSNHPRFERAFELLNKTNQFNTTGQRWARPELEAVLASGGVLLCSLLRDRLADNGMIGVIVVQGNAILQAVLSCRAFQFGAEYVGGRHACEIILENHDRVVATLLDTGRNKTCHGFFANMGFVESSDGSGWAANSIPAAPLHLKILFEDTPLPHQPASDTAVDHPDPLDESAPLPPRERWFFGLRR